MRNETLQNLSHLLTFRERRSSYQYLLAELRTVVKERLMTPIFIAEDLWGRRPCFGGLKQVALERAERGEITWDVYLRHLKQQGPEDLRDQQVILLIRAFLSYAVEQRDLRRSLPHETESALNGYTFFHTRPTQKQ